MWGSALVWSIDSVLQFVQGVDVAWLFCCQDGEQQGSESGGVADTAAEEGIGADDCNLEQLLTLKWLLPVLLLCLLLVVIVIYAVLKKTRSVDKLNSAQTESPASRSEHEEGGTGAKALTCRHTQLGYCGAELHQSCAHKCARKQQLKLSKREQPVWPCFADDGARPHQLISDDSSGVQRYHDRSNRWAQQCVINDSAQAQRYRVDEAREQRVSIDDAETQRYFFDTEAQERQYSVDTQAQVLFAGGGQRQQQQRRVSRCVHEMYVHEGSGDVRGLWTGDAGARRSVLARVVRPACSHRDRRGDNVVYLLAKVTVLGQRPVHRSLSSPCL